MGKVYAVLSESNTFEYGSEEFMNEFSVPKTIEIVDDKVSLFSRANEEWTNFDAYRNPLDHKTMLVKSEEQNETYGENKGNYDLLTGLPLRRTYWDMADAFLNLDSMYCMLVVDIKNFRLINKWFGRGVGDQVLISIGNYLHRLDELKGTFSGYMGGDNFCIIFKYNLDLIEEITESINELVRSVEGLALFSVRFGGYVPHVEVSAADMYDACLLAISKLHYEDGNVISWFDESMEGELQDEATLMPKVREGLANHEFTIYLQPKCQLQSGRIVGAEALVRWSNKEQGMIPPNDFIPTLETNGYILELDVYVWDLAFQTVARWIKEGRTILPISVNVSRIDIYSADVVAIFTGLAKKYDVPPKYIEIEITESAYVDNETVMREAENSLKKAGFTLLIDDFGSGYSSLNMLKDADVDVLKLDMKFLDLNEMNTEKGVNIMKSVLDMAHELDLPSIAEGVEKEEQLEILSMLGCEYVQGYYFYKPMPIEQFENIIAIADNVALDEIRHRRLDKSYTKELLEYFWKVAEVNVVSGEFHFIKNVREPDFIAYPRPKDIGEYVNRYLDHDIIHPDDVELYKYHSSIETIRKCIEMGGSFTRYALRYSMDGHHYQWYTFEVKKLSDYSEENPIVLFTWKVGDDYTSVREDTRQVLADLYHMITKYNLKTKENVFLKIGRKHVSDDLLVLHAMTPDEIRKAGIIDSRDVASFIRFINNDSLRTYFASNDEPLSITYNRVFKDGKKRHRMTIRKSLEYSEDNPVVLIMSQSVAEEKKKYNYRSVKSPYIDNCLYNFEVNVSRDIAVNNIDYINYIAELGIQSDSFSKDILVVATRFVLPQYRKALINFMNCKRLIACYQQGRSVQTIDYQQIIKGEPKWIRVTSYLYEQSGNIMMNVICSEIDQAKKDELRLLETSDSVLTKALGEAKWKNALYESLYETFENPLGNIEKPLHRLDEYVGAESGILVRFEDGRVVDIHAHPLPNKFAMLILQATANYMYDELSVTRTDMKIYHKATDARLFANFSDNIETLVVIPLYHENGVMHGLFSFANPSLSKIDADMIREISHVFMLTLMHKDAYRIIHHMGTHDLLTSIKNRNSFESELEELEMEYKSLGCIYIDVNGLHEMNNNQGHEEGDHMLQRVADSLTHSFDKQKCYRIGGDEFVVFSSFTKDVLIHKMEEIVEMLHTFDYEISYGIAYHDELDNITDLVNEAEHLMSENKKKYYENHSDRRINR